MKTQYEMRWADKKKWQPISESKLREMFSRHYDNVDSFLKGWNGVEFYVRPNFYIRKVLIV